MRSPALTPARSFPYCRVLWTTPGIRSLITFARAETRSVMTSVGARCAINDAVRTLTR